MARYNNLLEAEKVLFEDAAIAPVYQASRAQLVSQRVDGVFVNPFGATYEYKWALVRNNFYLKESKNAILAILTLFLLTLL
ncbi:hypothetical protein [Oceanobacillus salinisoli]|uniref:hypothetical protein n=1 Tax=Oceanobacillus salinisoli TaxID=2678611 RepID=UPI0038B3BF1C